MNAPADAAPRKHLDAQFEALKKILADLGVTGKNECRSNLFRQAAHVGAWQIFVNISRSE